MLPSINWGPRRRPRAQRWIVRARCYSQCLGALTATALATLSLGVAEAQAGHSSTPNPFKSASISWDPSGGGRPTPPNILVGHDGNRYTHLVGEISTRFRLRAEVKSGHRIYGWVITTGDPDFTSSLPLSLIGEQRPSYTKSLDVTRTFALDAKTAVASRAGGGIFPNSPQDIIDRCNNAFSTPPSQDTGVGQIQLEVHAGFSAGAYRGTHFNSSASWYGDGATSRPAIAHTTYPATIVCLNRNDFRSAELSSQVTRAQLGVATFGDTCPKPAAATVMINAEAPRPVRYKIERGNGTTTTENWIQGEIKLQKAPDGRQRPLLTAQHKLPALDPGNRRFRLWIDGWGKTPWRTVEVDCSPFKVTSAWLRYDVEHESTCPKRVVETATFHTNRPGKVNYEIKHQGGLVVSRGMARAERQGDKYVATAVRSLTIGNIDTQFMADVQKSPTNSGWVPLKIDCLEALSGKVTLKSLGATSCKGEALVAIHTNGAGKLPYELECGPGRSWQRSVNTPAANKIGIDKVSFDVKNNELVTCALRARIGGQLKSLDGASTKFQCHRRNVDTDADDFAAGTRPDSQKPDGPGRVVVDPPKACPRGTVGRWPNCRKLPLADQQKCPRGTVGKYPNCRKVVVDPPRTCPRGMVGRPPNCKRKSCPRGTVGTYPNCRKPVRVNPAKCPRGMVGRPPNCKARPCPRGQVRVRGRCIRPAT